MIEIKSILIDQNLIDLDSYLKSKTLGGCLIGCIRESNKTISHGMLSPLLGKIFMYLLFNIIGCITYT